MVERVYTTDSNTQNTGYLSNKHSRVTREDFLKLLVTQLSNQDPLNPIDNQEFLAQIAQIQSLEEAILLNQTMTDFVSTNKFNYATSLIGREISGTDESGNTVSGTVEKVRKEGNDIYLIIEDSKVNLSDIAEIK